ncbi:MAG: hypothetical protein KIH09_16035 [Candidatus Freyarchaeota archaeon]|nr:hypothetical protein [Candidatus Jordarchaeia archaeon]
MHDVVNMCPFKEPLKKWWIWAVFVIIYLLAVPWYFPTGYVGPIIFGFPLWALIVFLDTITLALWVTFVLRKHFSWNVEDFIKKKVVKENE